MGRIGRISDSLLRLGGQVKLEEVVKLGMESSLSPDEAECGASRYTRRSIIYIHKCVSASAQHLSPAPSRFPTAC